MKFMLVEVFLEPVYQSNNRLPSLGVMFILGGIAIYALERRVGSIAKLHAV